MVATDDVFVSGSASRHATTSRLSSCLTIDFHACGARLCTTIQGGDVRDGQPFGLEPCRPRFVRRQSFGRLRSGSRIAISWRRCLIDHKLDPARHGPPQTLTESEVRHIAEPIEESIRVAMPELEDLARVLRDAGYCVNLADANATMLISRLPGGVDDRMFLRLEESTPARILPRLRGNQWAWHRARRAETDPGASRRAFPRAMGYFHAARGAAVRSCRPFRRRGEHHVLAASDLDRAAHQLALAVTMEATRRIERSIFRRHFRNGWIATLPGDGGNGLLAYDDDRRIVGACRSCSFDLGADGRMIESGIDLSRFIQFDDQATGIADDLVELRRADGSPLGHGQIAPPVRARPATGPLDAAPRNSDEPVSPG